MSYDFGQRYRDHDSFVPAMDASLSVTLPPLTLAMSYRVLPTIGSVMPSGFVILNELVYHPVCVT